MNVQFLWSCPTQLPSCIYEINASRVGHPVWEILLLCIQFPSVYNRLQAPLDWKCARKIFRVFQEDDHWKPKRELGNLSTYVSLECNSYHYQVECTYSSQWITTINIARPVVFVWMSGWSNGHLGLFLRTSLGADGFSRPQHSVWVRLLWGGK